MTKWQSVLELDHEVFIQIGWGYFYSEQKLMAAVTHPLVRVSRAMPLVYGSKDHSHYAAACLWLSQYHGRLFRRGG